MLKFSKEFIRIIDDLKNTIEYKVEDITFNLAVQINDRIKELRINKTELAKRLGVSKSYVSQILNGNNNLTIESIIKIADVIDLQPIIKLSKFKTEIIKMDNYQEVDSNYTLNNDFNERQIAPFILLPKKENILDGNNIEEKSNYQTA